jgi:hypothetical protein
MSSADAFPGTFPGTIGVPPDVADLCRRADVVVVAKVISIDPDGDVTLAVNGADTLFHRQVATASVEAVAKGVIEGRTVRVQFLMPDAPAALATLAAGERVVLFLTASDPAGLVDPANGKLGTGGEAVSAIREAIGDPEAGAVAQSLIDAIGPPHSAWFPGGQNDQLW